jgi:prepilin-type N-terminal cleavage/methylation domain-containing protein
VTAVRGETLRSGFTLVEVLVSLVVLQVGLLGVVGTLLLASRTLRGAELTEWAVAEVQRTADSLLATGAGAGAGQAPSGPGELRWEVDGGGRLRVEYHSGSEILVTVEGMANPGANPEANPTRGAAGGGEGG